MGGPLMSPEQARYTPRPDWTIGELLGGVSDEDTRRLAAMLKSFRSNWEGRE